MTQRPSPFTVAPDGMAALVGVEKYLQSCGLDHKLIALVKTRISQINGCAYCLHMHIEEDGNKLYLYGAIAKTGSVARANSSPTARCDLQSHRRRCCLDLTSQDKRRK